MNVLELLRIKSSQEDMGWQEAREVMRKVGGFEVLQKLATGLREQGDDSAIVIEHSARKKAADFVVLRWDLSKRSFFTSDTWWDSKGVSINASYAGDVAVCFTGGRYGGWYVLDSEELLNDVSLADKIEEFLKQERTLKEKVRFATTLARFNPDYRFGTGKKSLNAKPVQGRFSKRIF